MRVTQNTFISQVSRQASERNAEILRLQEQLTSGVRIQRPSDDPGVIGSLLANKSSVARMDVDLQNVASARTRLNQGHAQLLAGVELMRTARDLAIDGAQSLERETIAQSIDSVLQQLVLVANSTDGGRPLFAGTATDGDAFEITGYDSDGRIATVEYVGVAQRQQTIVGPGLTVDVLYGGEDVFGLGPHRDTTFTGNTGAQSGVSRDTAIGRGTLTIGHQETIYHWQMGVQPGASSDQDTVIGFGRDQIRIENTSDGRTISLNGGTPVPFDETSTDLAVADPEGRLIHVDMSAVPIDAEGTSTLFTLGTASIDGGTTEVPINFTDDQALFDSVTGHVTFVDTTNVRRVGEDDVHYGGRVDAFQSLIQLRDLLLNSDGLPENEFQDRMELYQADLQVSLDRMLDIVGEQSVDLENLDRLDERTTETQLETQIAIADTENADLTEVILQLQSEQTLLEYIYASAAGTFDVNLLDFIR